MSALTLLQHSGAAARTPSWSDAVLILIDAQQEYVDGRLPLAGITEAVAAARRLLDAARDAGVPVIHIVHLSPSGQALFAEGSASAEIIAALTPLAGETVIAKRLPNSFAGTRLAEVLGELATTTGRREIVLAGFMTHMCVSSTARAALDLGIPTTIVANATATRDLPDPLGGIIRSEALQRASLAALADRFATVIADGGVLARPPQG